MHLLTFQPSARARTAWRNRQEIVNAGLSRRDMLRMGLLTSGGFLVAKAGLSARSPGVAFADDQLVSPPTRPFIEPLPIPPVANPVPLLSPAPQTLPLPGEGRVRPHQALDRFPPRKLYEMRVREALASFHPDLPTQPVWTFDGTVPGPTIKANYGEPILVRVYNDLPQDHKGFGVPQISTHLHNAHTPSESDGFPLDFYPFKIGGPERFSDHHFPNCLAGLDLFGPAGDPRESLGTLWYHDHRVDFTSPNVYKGLAGFYCLTSPGDGGDETLGYRLPSGAADVPMLFADKLFDTNGQLYFDLFGFDGLIGDKFTVNGKIQPFMEVEPRRYRFRWLDGGPSRFYQLFLTDLGNPGRALPFTQIGNDGNLLPQSVSVSSVLLAVAERADVVVDFAPFAGKTLYLENRLEQTDGRAPTGNVLPAGAGDLLVQFRVKGTVSANQTDFSLPPPYSFYEVPTPSATDLSRARTRTWRFDRENGQWAVNGQLFDPDIVSASIPQGSSEVWVLQNSSGGWQHPIHIHFEEFQILARNGRPTSPIERGRKDVVRLGFDEEVRLFLRFRDFKGRYVMHCHNTLHEDHAMMVRWDIV